MKSLPSSTPDFPQKYFWWALLSWVFIPLLISLSILQLVYSWSRKLSDRFYIGELSGVIIYSIWLFLAFQIGNFVLGENGIMRMSTDDPWNVLIMLGLGIILASFLVFFILQASILISLAFNAFARFISQKPLTLSNCYPRWSLRMKEHSSLKWYTII